MTKSVAIKSSDGPYKDTKFDIVLQDMIKKLAEDYMDLMFSEVTDQEDYSRLMTAMGYAPLKMAELAVTMASALADMLPVEKDVKAESVTTFTELVLLNLTEEATAARLNSLRDYMIENALDQSGTSPFRVVQDGN